MTDRRPAPNWLAPNRLVTLPAVAAVMAAMLLPAAESAAAAPHPAHAWDFNGDGHGDMAIGASGRHAGAGVVTVIRGTAAGLATSSARRWSQDSPGMPGTSEPDDAFGSALASGDFDGDGYADLAVAADAEDSATTENAGAVTVLFGGPHGITAKRAVRLRRPGKIFGQVSSEQTRMGYLLASGDFDRDGHSDLVVAIQTDGPPSGLLVYRGSADGIHRLPAQQIAAGHGLPDQDQSFTNDLAVGDLDGNGAPDLALGWQETDQAHGAVAVIYAARGVGLDVTHAKVRKPQVWSRTTDGVKGSDSPDTAFGSGVGIGDVTGDGYKDLVVTAQHIPPGDPGTAGDIHVLRGSAHGVTPRGDQLLRYDAIDDAPVGSLGYAVAVGDLNHDGIADVAVTHASADANEAGAVTVLYGAAGGLQVNSARSFTQDSAGIGGANRPDVDYWGLTLRIGDVGGSRTADLLVADPYEPVGGQDAGLVNVLWGSAAKVSGNHSTTISEATPGIAGDPESTDRFGIAL